MPDPTKCPAGTAGNGVCADGYCGPLEQQVSCDYTLNDIVGILPIVAKFILSIVGSLSLLAFVYGGVMFIISSGSVEKVTKAKGIIVSAVIGLIIVFVSYTIIGFIFTSLGIGEVEWFTPNWFGN
ncbi:MAG: hypothetical protein ABIA02_00680 [Candidatus Falkowbacteria bacterium]